MPAACPLARSPRAPFPSDDERRDLCARAVRGDRPAAAELVESVAPWLWREAGRLHRPTAPLEREDLFQAGAVGVLESLPKYDPPRGPCLPHLLFAARRAMIDALKAAEHLPQSAPLTDDGETLIDLAAAPEIPEKDLDPSPVPALLARLPEEARRAVEMTFGIGTRERDLGEIAAALGCSRPSASARVGRALKALAR
jgi:RNA polymerase sigma factor (sigma-70 family)